MFAGKAPLEFVSEQTIELMTADTNREKSTIAIYGYGPGRLDVIDGRFSGNTYAGYDVWDAFCKFRTEAENAGYLLLCNGARRDAVQSGMSRDMGNGMTIYLTETGKPVTAKSLVQVFEPASRELVAKLAEQEAANREWRQSLR